MKRSFTLIEIIVAMGLFSLVSAMGIGAFVISQNLNHKISNLRLVEEETSNAIEFIKREVNLSTRGGLIIESEVLSIQKVDPKTGLIIKEKFSKSTDGKSLIIKTEKEDGSPLWESSINSQLVILNYLKFSPAGLGSQSGFINIEVEFMENPEKVIITPKGDKASFRINTTAVVGSF